MAAILRRESFLNIIPLVVFLLIAITSASSSKADTNVLLTGQILGWENKLSYADTGVSLVMNYYCKLVLYDSYGHATWESDYPLIGPFNCSFSLTDDGRLVILTSDGRQLWLSSNAISKVGKYAAVLRPDGQVSIYGPAVWATAVGKESIDNHRSNSDEMVSSTKKLENSPMAYNVLFSGNVLYDNGELSDNGYSFVMTEDCELVLRNSGGTILWNTWTKGEGKNCFARLSYKGELAIRDDDYALKWSSEAMENAPIGEYVLVMQQNGNAVIYGPEVWSTAYSKSGFVVTATA